jgi:hypothetical protein
MSWCHTRVISPLQYSSSFNVNWTCNWHVLLNTKQTRHLVSLQVWPLTLKIRAALHVTCVFSILRTTKNSFMLRLFVFPISDMASLVRHEGLRESHGPSETSRHLDRELNSGPYLFQRLPATYLYQTCRTDRALWAAEVECVKANSHIPCRFPAALIHTCHAATLPFSESAVSFVKVRVVDGNIPTASLLLVTTFVELRVVAGRSRTRADSPHAVSGRPMLIHTYHAVPMPRCAVAVRCRFQNGMVVAWQGNGMACMNQTRPHCVNQMGETKSKHLAERHGRGTASHVWISLKMKSEAFGPTLAYIPVSTAVCAWSGCLFTGTFCESLCLSGCSKNLKFYHHEVREL